MHAASRTMGGMTLEQMLLDRHLTMDARLERAIEAGDVGQVIEIAAGLSGRGRRFCQRYAAAELIYVEGDLAAMASRKRRLLGRAGGQAAHHHVVELNALADDGPASLGAATSGLLDPARGTAIVTEGLINYFDRPTVLAMWQRFAAFLSTFPAGLYLTELHGRASLERHAAVRLFLRLLRAFARGRIHLHFADEPQAVACCLEQGFARAEVIPAAQGLKRHPLPNRRDHAYLSLLEAWTAGG